MSEETPKPEELLKISYSPLHKDWMKPAVDFRKGTFGYSAFPKHQEYLGLPNPRQWQPFDTDWKLPDNWKEIILSGM